MANCYAIGAAPTQITTHLADRYLSLLRMSLTRSFPEPSYAEIPRNTRTPAKAIRYAAYSAVQRMLKSLHLSLVQVNRATGETMMGMGALENLHWCMERVLVDAVPGDFVETGVWRGGGTIYMRAFLEAYGDASRNVWVADSFEGLPKPSSKYYTDSGSTFWQSEYLAISLPQVQENFRRYGLLDDRVRFLKGFFSDTMPTAPIEQIAVLRLDGDMYESTIVVLEHLYPRLSLGGYCIIDDYSMVPACKQAVLDYRQTHGIQEQIEAIGYVNGSPHGVYWRKSTARY